MNLYSEQPGPIGIFDSGYGGLTILEDIRRQMPEYDYIYLGDNARTPYGTRSFEIVYEFTREAVLTLFERGCQLVILACNTASAKALRSIQQKDLPRIAPNTTGTIQSCSYPLEIKKLYPDYEVFGEACPMWVPLVENNEHRSPGADYFVRQYIDRLMEQCSDIDTVILGCTHYPLLLDKIKTFLPEGVLPLPQGDLVAASLKNYLYRHPEMERRCTKNGSCRFLTTESPQRFSAAASLFLQENVNVSRIVLEL